MLKDDSIVRKILKLEPEDQLSVMDLLADELKLNEEYHDQDDQYNVDRSSFLRQLLKEHMNSILSKSIIERIQDRYASLSEEHKYNVLLSIDAIVQEELEYQENAMNKAKCEEEGHVFSGINGGWRKQVHPFNQSTLEKYIPGEHSPTTYFWERTCQRCKALEVSYTEPPIVSENNKQEEKAGRVRILQMELDQLKGKPPQKP